MKTLRINSWSGPRNVSTALMYSFAQREDAQVVDEPFYAYYLAKTGIYHLGREEIIQSQSSNYQDVIDQVILAPYEKPLFFIKNMAQHLVDMDWDFLAQLSNIILIREPDQMLTSFIKKIPQPTLHDTAYLKLYELYHYLQDQGQQPLVIDAKELLLHPCNILQQLCKRLAIPFDKAMLNWPAGARAEDGVWAKYWYKNVHLSTTFQAYKRKEEKVPDALLPLLKECEKYYNFLYKHALVSPLKA